MMKKFKKPLIFSLALLPLAAVSGIFVGFYQLDTYSEEIIQGITAELGSTDILIAIGAIQTVIYTLFTAFFGYILAVSLGLWKPLRLDKKSLIFTLGISLISGIIFSLDHFTFGAVIDGIRESNLAALTPVGFIASVLYGGVIEEIMLRLFFMSLVAFAVWKLFFRRYGSDEIPKTVFVIANLTSAILFAASHLPATLSTFGTLTPLILFRCFLLNGGFGLVFGYLFRRYGIIYSIMSHALVHTVCKLILLIFA